MIRHQPGHDQSPNAAPIAPASIDLAPLDEAVRMQTQARNLLRRLVADRASSAERFREAGHRDAIELVTGRTSFDNAIAATRQMISRMDALLAEFAREARLATEANEVALQPS